MPEKYQSFCVTVRPLLGLSDETLQALNKYAESQDHAFAVVEKEAADRHWHAQFWFNNARARGQIAEAMARICERTIEDWSKPQLKVLRNGVRIAYSDWHLSYLSDNEEKEAPNIQVDTAPLITHTFYPTEEEQAATQAKINAADPQFHKLATMYREAYPEDHPTERQVALWLGKQELVDKTIPVTRQKRDRLQRTRLLWLYLLGEDASDAKILEEYARPDAAVSPEVKELFSQLDI